MLFFFANAGVIDRQRGWALKWTGYFLLNISFILLYLLCRFPKVERTWLFTLRFQVLDSNVLTFAAFFRILFFTHAKKFITIYSWWNFWDCIFLLNKKARYSETRVYGKRHKVNLNLITESDNCSISVFLKPRKPCEVQKTPENVWVTKTAAWHLQDTGVFFFFRISFCSNLLGSAIGWMKAILWKKILEVSLFNRVKLSCPYFPLRSCRHWQVPR